MKSRRRIIGEFLLWVCLHLLPVAVFVIAGWSHRQAWQSMSFSGSAAIMIGLFLVSSAWSAVCQKGMSGAFFVKYRETVTNEYDGRVTRTYQTKELSEPQAILRLEELSGQKTLLWEALSKIRKYAHKSSTPHVVFAYMVKLRLLVCVPPW